MVLFGGTPADHSTGLPFIVSLAIPEVSLEAALAQEELDLEKPPEALSRGEAEAQAETLRQRIQRHNYLYYVEARPEVSDGEYDTLFARLALLEESFPGLATSDSPTQRVGAEPREDLPAVRHTAPMLSLDSTKEEDDLIRFDERIRKAVGESPLYLVEPKLDGASVELVYEEGVLVRRMSGREIWSGFNGPAM